MKPRALCIAVLLMVTPAGGSAEGTGSDSSQELAERNLEDWVSGMCPEFTEDRQRAYWLEMRTRYRNSRRRTCALTQTGKELVYAPFTLGISLISAGERWDRCLDDGLDWSFQSQIVSGRLEGYRPGDGVAPAATPNEFFVTLRNSGKLAMRDITLSCDLIGSKLQRISSSKPAKFEEPLLSGKTRQVSLELDPRDRWFCYSMCVYTYTTDY